MIGVTIFITLAFGVLALLVRPGMALGVLIAATLVWPEYLRIPLGVAEMSATRIIALALLSKLFVIGRQKNLKLCAVDWLVIFLWLWTVLASVLSGAESSQIWRMLGQGFDTTLIYFVARLSIRSSNDLKDLALPLFLVAVYMCAMGWVEAVTTKSPYMGLDSYRQWVWFQKPPEFRLGLMRAKVSTSVHIFFGMAMMLLAGIAWALRTDPRVRKISILAAFFAGFGALSSMSSGPWLAIITLIFCNLYMYEPKFIKPTLLLLLGASVFIELVSNRHFYNLIDYLALNSGTAWYRTRLLEVAASQWRDYWLFGTGDKSIQYWGGLLDGRQHIDLVNHFVITAVNGGLGATIAYIGSHIYAIVYGIRARRRSKDKIQRNLIFGLICVVISLDISSMSVGLFGPPLILSNILLGILVSASVAWRQVPAANRNIHASHPVENGTGKTSQLK